ncbi:MAG: SRPBCC family protein [Actinomycetota bacterium]|nr:SRPBCC family protein [Actinomycetota bacterium]
MRIEATQRIPAPRRAVYGYLVDPDTWIYWMAGIIDISRSEHTTWTQPGDRIAVGYRLLGRRIEAQVELDEIQPAQYVKLHATTPVGTVAEEWFLSDAGETSTSLRTVYETDEPTNFFGKIIDRTVIPRAIERDFKATMGNLEQIFAMGIPD